MLHEKEDCSIQRAVRERNIPYIGWVQVVMSQHQQFVLLMICQYALLLLCLHWFIPVQINPHYIDASISGHMGETRDERNAEFYAINLKRLLWLSV